MQPIEFDITPTLDKFKNLEGSMEFLISKSLNDVAFDKARNDLSITMNEDLEIKNKTITRKNAFKIKRSNKNNLEVKIFYQLGNKKDSNINKWMGLQQFGGTEISGSNKIAIPIRRNMAMYAGVSRKTVIKNSSAISVPKMINKSRAGQKYKGKRVVSNENGIFLEINRSLKMMYSFVEKANHNKKLFKFQESIEQTYNKNFERYFRRNFLRVLKG